jgi:hypothetical protein
MAGAATTPFRIVGVAMAGRAPPARASSPSRRRQATPFHGDAPPRVPANALARGAARRPSASQRG